MNNVFDYSPFENIHDYIKSVIIINKLYCKTKNNTQEIQQCIQSLVGTVSEIEINRFISIAINCTRKHPYEILSNIDEFKAKIDQYCIEHDRTSVTIESSATKCLFCLESKSQWFIYANPIFGKDAVLFTKSKIGEV